jgi:hypothetical protein
MARDWASTVAEIITSPLTLVTKVVDGLAGTPAGERFDNSVKTDVFHESHLRNLDKLSADRQLHPGTVLRVGRPLYWHYGVYVGGDEAVHFTSEDSDVSENNQVMRTSMSKFLGGAEEFQVLAFPDIVCGRKTFSREETCLRAIEKIGMGDYSIFNNNCQHFAMWCRTGVAISGQTVIVNGGESDAPVYYTPSGALSAAGGIWNWIKAPDLIEMFNVEVSRTLFASNYRP